MNGLYNAGYSGYNGYYEGLTESKDRSQRTSLDDSSGNNFFESSDESKGKKTPDNSSSSSESDKDDDRSLSFEEANVKNGILITPPKKPEDTELSKSCPETPKTPISTFEIDSSINLKRKVKAPEIINRLLLLAKTEKDPLRKASMYNALFITSNSKFAVADLHVHLEGIPNEKIIAKWLQTFQLLWDPDKRKFCKRKKTSFSKMFKFKKSPKKLTGPEIREMFCVELKNDRTMEEKINASVKFDSTFGPRSFLDKIPLSEQFLNAMEKDKNFNLILCELMFGVYLLPVPQSLKKIIEKYHDNMTEKNINECMSHLMKKLDEIFNVEEKSKLRKKIQKKFGIEFYEKLMNISYLQAFKNIMDIVLKTAEKEVKEKITEKKLGNPSYKLNPNIFDAKSPQTLKLIFEVMRHYDLASFFAWSYCAFHYIETDNSRIVAVTIDGPQKHENSIKYFKDHIDIIKYLRSQYKKVKVTVHTLEFSKDEFNQIEDSVHELTHVLTIADRVGHATMAPFTADQRKNLARLQKGNITIELCLTSAEITTGEAPRNMPLMAHHNGISVVFGTDDPGIVCKNENKSSFTNVFEELVKAIDTFNLTWEDIETIARNNIKFSFLEGNSIYNIDRIKSEDNKVKIVYELNMAFKENFIKVFGIREFDWKECAEYYEVTGKKMPKDVKKSLSELKLSDKAIKECHLEISLEAFKESIEEDQNNLDTVGYINFKRSNSSSPILYDRTWVKKRERTPAFDALMKDFKDQDFPNEVGYF